MNYKWKKTINHKCMVNKTKVKGYIRIITQIEIIEISKM